MAMDKVMTFLQAVLQLPSFPVFCAYVMLVPLSILWQKISHPLTLRWMMVFYNTVCCIVSAFTLAGFAYGLYMEGSLFKKQSSDLMRPVFQIYWFTKCLELLDTVFMVLRHRRRQISFLHIYHHSSMVLLSDYAWRHTPWPAIAPFLAINSFVHIILYLYYALAALNPTSPPPWKRHVTELQIIQFFVGFIISGYGYLYAGYCIYGILYGIVMTSLFSNFYYHAYLRPRSSTNAMSHQQVKGVLRTKID